MAVAGTGNGRGRSGGQGLERGLWEKEKWEKCSWK